MSTTPIIQTLIPLVRDYGTRKAIEWLEGREELAIPDDDLTSFLARQDVDFMYMLESQMDEIRDVYMEAVKAEIVKRSNGSDSQSLANRTETAQAASSRSDVEKYLQQADQLIDRCLHLLDEGAPQMAREAAHDAGCAISDADRAFAKLSETPSPVSPAGSVAVEVGLVEDLWEALDSCRWSGTVGGGQIFDEERVESVLSRLGSLREQLGKSEGPSNACSAGGDTSDSDDLPDVTCPRCGGIGDDPSFHFHVGMSTPCCACRGKGQLSNPIKSAGHE